MISRLRWAGHVVRMVEDKNAFKILTGKHIGKKPLARRRPRREGNNTIDIKEIAVSMRKWFHSAQDKDY